MAHPTIGNIIGQHCRLNWVKDFPVIGQGTLIFSIERSTKFSIVIRPKLKPDEYADVNADCDVGMREWIALTVDANSATFSMYHKGILVRDLVTVKGMVRDQPVGFEPDRKISYWLSYNRDLLTIKYGKGYCMEETTLMTHNFLKGVPEKEQEATRTEYEFLFSHYIRRSIEQYDSMTKEVMLQKYGARCMCKGISLSDKLSDEELLKGKKLAESIIDIESKVTFDKDPLVCNWSPFVLDSSKLNLFELDSNTHTFSASLPPACLELYTNVTAPDIDLNWSNSGMAYKFFEAIQYSIDTPECILYKKLEEKETAGQFGSKNTTYLRVTLGKNRGSSPGIPYVLEIWPGGHGSPIHNHGNAYAVIKVLHGGLTISVFNKQVHTDSEDTKHLKEFKVRKGDCTWISPNWFQTHKLWNHNEAFCATIQCYQYGKDDNTQWPYFDYVDKNNNISHFLPDSDFTFQDLHKRVMEEYTAHMESKELA